MSSKKAINKEDVISIIRKYSNKVGTSLLLDVGNLNGIGSSYSWDNKDKVLCLNTDKIIEDGFKKELFLILKENFESGNEFILNDIKPTITAYENYTKSNDDQATLEFFREIIPIDDFNALKMSLFLRYQDSKHKPIGYLKEDIISKYGSRGGNISNLCSARYFEEEFKPLYNEISREKFNEYYEAVVMEKAKALFVSSKHDINKLEIDFLTTLNKAKRFAMKLFKIYARGKQNISLIRRFVGKIDKADDVDFSSIIPFKEFTIQRIKEDHEIPAIEYEVKILKHFK